jgi:hypothetical protein
MSAQVQWEYHVEKFSNWKGVKPEDVEATLNSMGADGWELVSVMYIADGAIWATAKRIRSSSSHAHKFPS